MSAVPNDVYESVLARCIAAEQKAARLEEQLGKERELRLALKWPVESWQVIDHFEEKYGKYIQLTPAEKSAARQVNPNVDFRILKRMKNWEYISSLTHLEIRLLLDKLNQHLPPISITDFASSIANIYKSLSDNIVHSLNLMVKHEAPPQGVSNLTNVELMCLELLKSL